MRRKILYLVTKSDWGGVQRYVFDLATNLPRDRFEVVVAAGGNGPLAHKLHEAGIRTLSLAWLERDIGFLKEFRAFLEIVRIVKKEKPDILHLNSPKAAGLGGLAAFLAKPQAPSSKLRVFSTVHGWPFYEDRPHWQKALIFLGSWFSSLFWDSVILINAADLKSAERFIPRKKLIFIPNGIGEIDFLPRDRARAFFSGRIGKPISEDMILIGAIAELTKNKGMAYLIDAVNDIRIRNYELGIMVLIIGEGEERAELENRIKNSGLANVFLLGFLEEAHAYLTGLDIFVLPSLKEGLPYVMLEAMQAGLPIAASAVGGVPDLIQQDKTGMLVQPKNPSALAETVIRLIDNPAERQRLGRAAQKTATDCFALRDMMRKIQTIYRPFE